MPAASSVPKLNTNAWRVLGAISKARKGSDLSVPALFHVNSHAVAGLPACLTVVPVLVIFKVMP
jgi:hypothetical protein